MTDDDELLLELLRSCVNKTEESCFDINMISMVDATFSEYFDDRLLDENGRISLAYENLKHIPRHIADRFGSQTKSLDLSYNNFTDFSFLSSFSGLHTLILDRNANPQESTFPFLPNLEILWLNNCSIKSISKWVNKIQRQCPIIRYLSLLGNPGAKTLFTGATIIEEYDYRTFVINALPTLVYLDDTPVPHVDKQKHITNTGKSKPLVKTKRVKKPKSIMVRNLLHLREICASSSTN